MTQSPHDTERAQLYELFGAMEAGLADEMTLAKLLTWLELHGGREAQQAARAYRHSRPTQHFRATRRNPEEYGRHLEKVVIPMLIDLGKELSQYVQPALEACQRDPSPRNLGELERQIRLALLSLEANIDHVWEALG